MIDPNAEGLKRLADLVRDGFSQPWPYTGYQLIEIDSLVIELNRRGVSRIRLVETMVAAIEASEQPMGPEYLAMQRSMLTGYYSLKGVR